jgi:hypothetical protein
MRTGEGGRILRFFAAGGAGRTDLLEKRLLREEPDVPDSPWIDVWLLLREYVTAGSLASFGLGGGEGTRTFSGRKVSVIVN